MKNAAGKNKIFRIQKRGHKVTYNWPDRFKLILVNILINLIVGVMISVFIMFQDISKLYFTELKQIFLAGILLSTLLTFPVFLREWKKLKSQEESNENPDLEDPRNIKPFQIIFIFLYIVLLVTSYTVSQMYSRTAGSLFFVAVIVLGGIERFVIRRKANKPQPGGGSSLR